MKTKVWHTKEKTLNKVGYSTYNLSSTEIISEHYSEIAVETVKRVDYYEVYC